MNYNWLFVTVGALGLLVVVLQTWTNYHRLKYDVVGVALKYVDLFFKDSRTERLAAARAVLAVLDAQDEKHRKPASENKDIEPVLDIIEDLGFLVYGNQISDEVVHNYFYHWIRMYLEPLEENLRVLHATDKAEYKYTLRLFDRLRFIEAKEMGWGFFRQCNFKKLKDEYGEAELRNDLREEIKDCETVPNHRNL